MMTGYFKQRYNKVEFEFKVTGVTLAETLKKILTKQVSIEMHPQYVTKEIVQFVEGNVKKHPGHAGLKFVLVDARNKMKVSLITMGGGFELNEDMIQFLETRPEMEVQVVTG